MRTYAWHNNYMLFNKPTQEALTGAISHGPLFDAVDVDALFAAIPVLQLTHVVEYVAAPVVVEADETLEARFDRAWARAAGEVVKSYKGNRKNKGGK